MKEENGNLTKIEIKDFTKKDLCEGDIVILRNGTKFYINNIKDELMIGYSELSDWEESLRHTYTEPYDIVQVFRYINTGYYEHDQEVYTLEQMYKSDAIKMTVDEISKKLGYDIEVVTDYTKRKIN